MIRNKKVPCAGLGTTVFWFNAHGEKAVKKSLELNTVRMIDCAEMYGYGRCERMAGKMIRDLDRNQIYIVDKILPENVREGLFDRSFEQSCERLGTDYIDLYLLHWRENTDLSYLVYAMNALKSEGRIGEWGVSNFDTKDMEDLFSIDGGEECFCDQVLYNLGERGIEFDLLPWLKEHDVLPMAYSSLGSHYSSIRNEMHHDPIVQKICRKESVTPEALMLAFVVNHDVSAVFSSTNFDHIQDNLAGLKLSLVPYMKELDQRWPAPKHKVPLAKL